MAAGASLRDAREVVAAVWADVLPYEPMQENLTWSDAGVDSLKSLQMLLAIEKSLGRKLTFDLFARDLTLGDLIRGLAEGGAAAESAPTGQRTVFLVPGIFGDEPRLADFRHALRDHAACETLTLPELDQPSELLSDLAATVRPLVRQVRAQQPDGPIVIAGYSFGSFVAYQMALDLQAAGRTVDLLCLLDAAPPRTSLAEAGEVGPTTKRTLSSVLGGIPRALRKPANESLHLYAERLVYRALMVARQFRAARWMVARNWANYDFDRGHERRRHLLEVFRGRAMAGWRPEPYAGRVLLIESDEMRRRGDGRHWSRWAPNLSAVVVGGDHVTIFDPGQLERLVPALVAALDPEASRPASAA
jgi:thioesterase domain-containing protein/acyl carrier protein